MSRPRTLRRLRVGGVVAVACVLAALAAAHPAVALPRLVVPVPPGQTWVVCQEYGASRGYALELTADLDGAGPAGCQGDAGTTAGREVLSPASGTVAWNDGDGICLDVDGGDSLLLGHVAGPAAGSLVAAGSTVGTVRAATAGAVATLRISAHQGPGCAGPAAVPFAEAAGTRFMCAPDLAATGLPNQWQGVWLAGCTQPGAFRADFDGDAKDDIAAFTGSDGAQATLWVFRSLGAGRLAPPVAAWDSGPGRWEWTRIKPLAGDFDGDGRGDVALFYAVGTAHTQLWVLRSIRGGFAPPMLVWDSGPVTWEWARMKPFVGDFNFDERSDVGVLYGHDGAQTRLWTFAATDAGRLGAPALVWDSGPGTWDWARSKPLASDVDGDERDDVAVFYGHDGAQTKLWALRSLKAGGFAPPALAWNSGAGGWEATRARPVAGDFDGDGRNEVAAFYAQPGGRAQLWTFRAVRGVAVTPGVAWDSGAGGWDSGRAKPVAGDFDGDETDDLAALYREDVTRTTLWTFVGGAAGFAPPALAWDSGPGQWDWARALPL